MLRPPLRERGRRLLASTDAAERARLANDLAVADPAGAMTFLLRVLDTSREAPVRRSIVNRLGRYAHPRVRAALAHHAEFDADAAIAILALDRLRGQRMADMRGILERRHARAQQQGDRAGTGLLAEEHDRWIALGRGTMLPGFLREPAALPPVTRANRARVLAFGDFGDGSQTQRDVAAAMLRLHKQSPFDCAVTLGDNFYSHGVTGPQDPRWATWWDALYDPFGIQFFATLGNHDWDLPDSPAGEILRTATSPSWRMPSPYYTFSAGPAQFFAIDSNDMSAKQLAWLDAQLSASRAAWKIVYGHHPIYSVGEYGDNQRMMSSLLPLLRGRADVYLAGHDHDLQHLREDTGVHFFVVGGGGAVNVRQPKGGPRALFAQGVHGFAVLDFDDRALTLTFFDPALNRLHETTVTATPRRAASGPGTPTAPPIR